MGQKIIYWVSTGLLCLMMTAQGVMGIVNSEVLAETYTVLGYSSTLVIPLAIAKLLAVVAILSKKVKILKSLAYYGLAIDFIVAATSHVVAEVPSPFPAIVALVLLLISYIYDRKLFNGSN